jgi:hypothetical protein
MFAEKWRISDWTTQISLREKKRRLFKGPKNILTLLNAMY